MKKLIGYHGILLLLAFSITLSISCEKEDNIVEAPEDTDSSQVQEDDPQEEEDEEEGSESEVDPDLVTASLVLDNMKIINGTPPDSGKKAKAYNDLKIDYDTIFWTTGITKRIKIKKPLGVSLNNGVRVYVPGADSYIEASLRDDEASDEVSILYFDFKHTDWNYLSITFPLEISPLDENGNPIDVFSVPAVIEEPYANITKVTTLSFSQIYGFHIYNYLPPMVAVLMVKVYQIRPVLRLTPRNWIMRLFL